MEEKKNLEGKITKVESVLKTLFASKRLLITVIVGVIIVWFAFGLATSKKSKVKISVMSVLKDINIISELSTLIVPYNSIYVAEEPKKNTSDKTKYKFYTAYEGTVTLGFDLNKINPPKIDEKERRFYFTLPEIRIIESQVDHNSIETIYVDKKYEKEGGIVERRKECDIDLKNKVKNEKNIYKLARESAEDTIRNLITPIINKEYGDYEIIFE